MPYLNLDDSYPDHPKVDRLSDGAFRRRSSRMGREKAASLRQQTDRPSRPFRASGRRLAVSISRSPRSTTDDHESPSGAALAVTYSRKVRSSDRFRNALPLSGLPPEQQTAIAAQVAQPKPPGKWLSLGIAGDFRPMAQIPSRGWWEWHWQRGIDPDSRRSTLPPGTRQLVIQRDGLVCGLCGGDVPSEDVHIDHKHPVSLGGSDALENLQVAHSLCNIRKGAHI